MSEGCGCGPFPWPKAVRAALSLSFDDARASQIERGIPVLDAYGVKATFYVSPLAVEERREDWVKAVEAGHEIGSHTLSHPCSGNFSWSRQNALEDYTLDLMAAELSGSDKEIYDLLGVKPETFAYPCGQTFVGRGENVLSYVPLVAERYAVGRGAFDETHNDPWLSDLAQVFACDADGATIERLVGLADRAIEEGGWLVLLAHDVGDGERQMLSADTLEEFLEYARAPDRGVWIDTVTEVGRFVAAVRAK